MRIQTAGALILLCAALPLVAAPRSACELLPAPVVHSITGRIVQVDPKHSRTDDAGRDVCAYVIDGTALTLSVLSLESETAARRAFAREAARAFDNGPSAQPLRGIGVEARVQISKHTHSGTMVARYSAVVFVLRGSFDQETLAALARSVVAQLERRSSE